VHHVLLHNCVYENVTGNSVNESLTPSQCFSPLGSGGCYGVTYAWDMGGQSLILPKEAGFRMGASNDSIHWFILEIHYDNPNLIPGLIDHTGVKITFTKNLRQYDAATIMLGNVDIREDPIPPGNSSYKVEATCPSECTQQWDHSINVFADLLHMHNVGSSIWSTIHHNNTRVPGYLNRIEYYQFNFQDYIPMNRTIYPGDRINTICIYDTTTKTTPVYFGSSSSDEMCLEFVAYYPLLKVNGIQFSSCGSERGRYELSDGNIIPVILPPGERNFSTSCNNYLLFGSDNITIDNPDIPNPDGDEASTFGMACPSVPALETTNWVLVWSLVGVGSAVLVAAVVIGVVLFRKQIKHGAYEQVKGNEK